MQRYQVSLSWRQRGVDDGCERDRAVPRTMADGWEGFAPADDLVADAQGAGTVVRPSAADPGLDGFGGGRGLSPNPPKRVSIAAGAWARDVSKWRCGYDVSAWVVLKVRGRDFGRQWRPTVAIWGEFDESAGNSGHPRSGPERPYGQDRLWCVRWSVVDTAVRPAEEWLAVWSVRDRTVFPRASAAGDAK